jgi:hypothetical protein
VVVQIRAGRVNLYEGEPQSWVRTEGSTQRDLERRMAVAKLHARGLVGVRTGTLLSTIRTNNGQNSSGLYVDLIAGGGRKVRYTMFHHDGTPPHRITTRRRKSLRFIQNGHVVFRRSVWHPGTRGTFFLTRALPFAGG